MTATATARAPREEMAWAAGLFDGEGTITFALTSVNRAQRRMWMAAVKQAADDRGECPVLERFHAAVDAGRLGGPYIDSPKRKGWSANRRPYFMWMARGDAARTTLKRLLPWLSTPKRERALVAFPELAEAA